MSRLASVFQRGKKVLVAYLCVGDPSPEESIALARACIKGGADMLELGVPFSDPTADGPAIARASQRAIAKGGGLEASLRVARAVRAESDVPIVLFGYYNPVFVRGESRVVREAAEAGVDALLIVDLPFDEAEAIRAEAAPLGVSVIPLVAPTTSEQRIAEVKASRWPIGFVYYVSVTGVTGTAALEAMDAGARAAKLREEVGIPVVVGFGIDSADKARAAARGVDGVVVGTAIVRAIEDGKTEGEREASVRSLLASIRAGLDS